MPSVKTFKYDVLIGVDDICNRQTEQDELLRRAKAKKRTIVFAPRRYGKTSLIKNVIGSAFLNTSRRHVVLFFDLMDVQSLDSIARRLHHSISQAISQRFPVKTLMKDVAEYLRGLSLQVEVDPVTGHPSISMTARGKETQAELAQFMDAVKTLTSKYPTMVILDEFPDIALVPEAEALFRGLLQDLGGAAVFILGSKRHLLTLMFQNARAPLFHYGDEIHFGPILLKDWLPYFRERMKGKEITIEKGTLAWILENLFDVPNAICEFGAWLVENVPAKTTLTIALAKQQLDRMAENKQSYAFLLQGYTEKEREILSALARQRFTLKPHSEAFLKQVHASKSSVGKIAKKLLDRGLIEYELDRGYRISDPLLGYYLATR